MAEGEEEEGGEESSPKEDKKASLEWKKMPKWEKAGVIIAGMTLVIMVYIWWKSQQGGGAVSSGQLPMGGYSPYYSGSQDMFPVPPAPPGQPNPQPPPAPSPTPPPTQGFVSQLPPGFQDKLGFVTWLNGSPYSIIPGSNGRIWAIQGQNYTQSQLLNTPIGSNPGQKFLFYQGPSQ